MTYRILSRYVAALLLFLPFALQAQEKGNTFVHTIQRGETVYSIARTYKVSPDAILRLNPSAADGIKAGTVLLIPQQGEQGARAEKYHTIQAGETLYQLTKTYKVDAESICKANPGLTAGNFQAGKVIRIPARAASESPAQAVPASNAKPLCKEMYRVKRKETLYSISRQFGLTEAEIVAANPEMKQPGYKLKRGEFICIPFPAKKAPAQPTISTSTSGTPSNAELLSRATKPSSKRLVRMGVLLPFKGNGADNRKMVEFYRGVLMAVEQIKKAGVSVNVYAYDSGQSAADLKKVLDSHPLSELDFIIGPLYAAQIPTLGEFCKKNQIRLVVPFSSQGEAVYQNASYYAVNPPKSFLFSEAAHLAAENFGGDNVILVDGKENDKDATDFSEALNKRLMQKGTRMGVLDLDASDDTWFNAMNLSRDNVLVPNGTSIKMLNRLFPRLKAFVQKHPQFNIKLLGYPEWQTYTSSHLENFYRFDTYAYSTFYSNPLEGQSGQFEKDYLKAFGEHTIASWPRFGMLGYDTAFFFLKGLSEFGDSFEQHVADVDVASYQHRFDFQRVSNWSGFINRQVELIHFTPSHSIELIRLKK